MKFTIWFKFALLHHQVVIFYSNKGFYLIQTET